MEEKEDKKSSEKINYPKVDEFTKMKPTSTKWAEVFIEKNKEMLKRLAEK